MTISPVVPPSRLRRFLRLWLPLIVLGLGALAAWGVYSWPADSPRDHRVMSTWVATVLTLLLLLGWFVLLSGLTWRLRLGILLLVGGAAWPFLHRMTFDGDMAPIFHLPWGSTADDVREAYGPGPCDLGPIDVAIKPGDFAEYRGPGRDGVVTGPPLARDWKARPPRQLWRRPGGGGYSSFAVAGNVAITLEQRRDQEAVVCYDAATGKERWAYAYPAHFTETLGGTGPRATPTIADGNVFSLGAAGMLVCLEATTGKPKWSVNILKDNDNVRWGMSGSPLVYDEVVVVNPGAQNAKAAGRALVAYSRATGSPVWQAGNAQAGYSSPMLATLAGKRQILVFDAEGLAGYDPNGHGALWRFPGTTMQGINVAQPLVIDGERVFISSGYDVGCAMLRVKQTNGKWAVEQVWRTQALHCKFNSPVIRQGFVYGLDDGSLTCVDAETGKRRWKGARYGQGQVLLAGDLLLIQAESGSLVLALATPEAPRELGKIPALTVKTWNPPALAHGKVFVRNDEEMACYDLREER